MSEMGIGLVRVTIAFPVVLLSSPDEKTSLGAPCQGLLRALHGGRPNLEAPPQ
jgi:hypothetical protein